MKYRLYPNKEQEEKILKTFDTCRRLWNIMLKDRIEYYAKNKKTLYKTPSKYKTDFPYLKEVDSMALYNVWDDLNQAYANFFEGRCGFPRFKPEDPFIKQYTTNNANDTISIFDGRIHLPKIGMVKIKLHRQPKEDWKLKKLQIRLEFNGKYYALLLYEYERKFRQKDYILATNSAIGLDYKSNGLYMDSNHNIGSTRKFRKESKDKIDRIKRKIISKRVGSKNYRKQRIRLRKLLCYISRQRKDNLHKISAKLANRYDLVCVESIDLMGIPQQYDFLREAIMDNGFATLKEMLDYKLSDRQRLLVKVDRYFPSSQICSGCGHKQPMKDLKVRTYKCPNCGLEIDRDWNAAINIKNEGIRMYVETLGEEYM